MRLIKLRRIKCAEHVACMGETRNIHTILVGEKGNHLQDLEIEGV
jgi:hypothetical protein